MPTQLKTETARRAFAARLRFGFALDSPCDVYELVCKYGLTLRFPALLDGGGAVTLNISETDYVGVYQYRYLEEPLDA